MPDRFEVEVLLAFLPAFSAPGRRFVLDAEPPPVGDGSVAQIPHPAYPDDVVNFFMTIGTAPWMDPHYRRLDPERFITDPSAITSATFAEVRALLNHCSRGERFCDGFWIRVLENGVVQAALRRLAVLVDDGGIRELDPAPERGSNATDT